MKFDKPEIRNNHKKGRYKLDQIVIDAEDRLKLKYKIPDPCLVLPHNYLFTDACNDGNVLDFLYKNLNAQAGDYNGNFMLKATEIVEEIVKILKIKE